MHMKHMQLRELVLKQIVQQGLVTLAKVRSEENPADLLTKAVNKKIVERFLERIAILLGARLRGELDRKRVDDTTEDEQ